jgi:serine/threonine protein phosphatase PrpC
MLFCRIEHASAMPLLSQGVTDAGSVRTHNEDRILLNDDLGLYVVCDGIGGRRKGELAAEIASSAIAHYVESSRNPMEVTWPYGFNLQLSLAANRLLTAAKLANRQVWRRSEESLE